MLGDLQCLAQSHQFTPEAAPPALTTPKEMELARVFRKHTTMADGVLGGGPSALAHGYAACPVRLRNQDKGSAAVAGRIVQPVRVLGPRSEAVVGRERLRLPEAPILPATPVGRILATNPHSSGCSLSDHSTPPRRVAATSII